MKTKTKKTGAKVPLKKLEEFTQADIDNICQSGRDKYTLNEISQMINNLADFVDAETLISQLSFVKDASEIVKLKQQEDENKPQDPYDVAYTENEITDANIPAVDDDADI